MSHAARACALLALLPLAAPAALAQSRTPWQQHDGLEVTGRNPYGLVRFTCAPSQHGDVCEYTDATIPPASDAGWGPAPNGEIIDFSIPSRVCNAPTTCMAYGDFTYFQSFVDIPANLVVTTFTIDFAGMDDGSRVTVFNSAYPNGLVIPGSYVFLGGSGTTDLAPYVVSGEVNRVVITQVDDCCADNNLRSAVVVLNGQPIPPDYCPGQLDDADLDGFLVCEDDCDDADATVHPGAADAPNDGRDGDCAFGDRFLLSPPSPGVAGSLNTWTVTGADPGQSVTVVAATTAGSTAVPTCPGMTVPMANPQIVGATQTDAAGGGSIQQNVPAAAAGVPVGFVAVQPQTCRISAPVVTRMR